MDGKIWRKFDENKVSNNHLLCTDPEVNRTIKALRRGDVITIKGCLASYTLQNGSRGSSTVRTDRGNGACETVWVDQLTVLESINKAWHIAHKASLLTFFGIILLRTIRFFVGIHTSGRQNR
jgi:hypothetical protein